MSEDVKQKFIEWYKENPERPRSYESKEDWLGRDPSKKIEEIFEKYKECFNHDLFGIDLNNILLEKEKIKKTYLHQMKPL